MAFTVRSSECEFAGVSPTVLSSIAIIELGYQQLQDLEIFRTASGLLGTHNVGQVGAAHLDHLTTDLQ